MHEMDFLENTQNRGGTGESGLVSRGSQGLRSPIGRPEFRVLSLGLPGDTRLLGKTVQTEIFQHIALWECSQVLAYFPKSKLSRDPRIEINKQGRYSFCNMKAP